MYLIFSVLRTGLQLANGDTLALSLTARAVAVALDDCRLEETVPLLGHDPRLGLLGQLVPSSVILRPAHLVLLIHTTGRHAQIHRHIVIVSSILFAVQSLTRVIRLVIHVLTVGHSIVA